MKNTGRFAGGTGPPASALTTTKVPQFDGTTSWEQYHQVFEAIVRSNGLDNDTAALQLFSHLEGDVLNFLLCSIGLLDAGSITSGPNCCT